MAVDSFCAFSSSSEVSFVSLELSAVPFTSKDKQQLDLLPLINL